MCGRISTENVNTVQLHHQKEKKKKKTSAALDKTMKNLCRRLIDDSVIPSFGEYFLSNNHK